MREQLSIPHQLGGRLWLSQAPSLKGLRMHRHDELELNLTTCGRAVYLVQKTRQELRAGTLIWLFPDDEHLLIDRSPDFAMWIMVIRPATLGKVCTTPRLRPLVKTRPKGSICRALQPNDAIELERLFAQLIRHEQEPPYFNAGITYAVLRAWDAFSDAGRTVSSTGVHPAVERAARILRDDDPSLNLPTLAGRCGLGADRLGRLFRQQTGVSLTAYRNRVRIDHFLAAYGRGDHINMLAAALAAGFGSYAQFHRVFKAVMGCSPTDYRRKMRAAGRDFVVANEPEFDSTDRGRA